MNVEQTAETIGIPVDQWPGKCYGIACELVNKRLVNGSPRYGHWLGPVSDDCPVDRFKSGGPFQRHGWIELCNSLPDGQSGEIVDPTRWVFEGVEPYIYTGPNDHYDAGGNQWRAIMERPCPAYNWDGKRTILDVWKYSHAAHVFMMEELFNLSPGITDEMAFWLANLALPRLGRHAPAIYRALVDAGLGARIPIDNRRMVLGEV